MQTLNTHLKQSWQEARTDRFTPDSFYIAGMETRTPADSYRWEGMRRGGDPSHPFVVFQVTLDGWGIYENAAGRHTLEAGRAFAATVPGAHQYYLPEKAPSWTFFWLLIRHSYVVARITSRQREATASAVLTVNEDSLLVSRAASLFTGGFPDRFAEEEALFTFLVAYERHVSLASESGANTPERELLMEAARRFVRENLDRPLDVSALAKQYAMSRSRFSHYFKSTTGTSPAYFMTRVRLEEVSHRLVQTNAPLRCIALETGFTDANQLCKVFRRHFRLSPGVFRQQMRP